MYRMMIGSRSSHIGWDDFNVDLVKFLPGGPFENQPGQIKACKERRESDLSTEIKIASKKKRQVTVKRKSIRLPVSMKMKHCSRWQSVGTAHRSTNSFSRRC
jgi:hypothetical protein